MFVKDESCIEEFTRIGRLPSVRSCTFGASEWEEEEEEEKKEGGYMSGSRICVNICMGMGVRGYQARSGGEREVDVPDVDSSR